MSAATDIAEREAREAELAELREAVTAAGHDVTNASDDEVLELAARIADEAEPEPAPPVAGDESIDEAAKELDKEMRRHEKALAKLLDADLPLEPAPFDGVIGFVIPGMLELRPNPRYQRCTTCNGLGQVLTGSVKAGQETVDCPDDRCRGRGYWAKSTTPPVPAAEQPAANGNTGAEWEKPTWLGDTTIQPT